MAEGGLIFLWNSASLSSFTTLAQSGAFAQSGFTTLAQSGGFASSSFTTLTQSGSVVGRAAACYLVQEADGTSKFQLEDASGFLIMETCVDTFSSFTTLDRKST